LLLAALVSVPACGPGIDLGSSLIWTARHETGDLSEWSESSQGAQGGSQMDTADATVVVTSDYSHTGKYSVRLGNVATGTYEAARLWRQSDFPTEAYYSAWLYLPSSYKTVSDWTVLQIRPPPGTDPTVTPPLLMDVSIRSLSTGDLILSIYDHRSPYLRAPTPVPPLFVPVGRWFQIEIYFRNVADGTGRFTLWLDGQQNYDLVRPMPASTGVYWTVCNTSEELSPAASAIYVDDVAVSLIPVTPHGTL
jgi:hypothetical protein